jgi:hypothetical protein
LHPTAQVTRINRGDRGCGGGEFFSGSFFVSWTYVGYAFVAGIVVLNRYRTYAFFLVVYVISTTEIITSY